MYTIWRFLPLFALWPTLAFAGPNDAEWNQPARYDRPYLGMLSVLYLPQKQTIAACKAQMGKAQASMDQ
jgi:hypothetical protein